MLIQQIRTLSLRQCLHRRFDSLCTSKTCSINECNKRHPKKCRYWSLFGRCKFGQNCSYKHEIEVVNEVEQLKAKYETLTQSFNQLQCELSSLKAKLMDTNGTTLINTQSSIQPNTTVVSDMQKVPQVDGAQDEASFLSPANDDEIASTPCRFKTDSRFIICQICGLGFQTNADFQLHDQKEYCCDICQICFSSQEEVKLHVLDFHPGIEPMNISRKSNTTQ